MENNLTGSKIVVTMTNTRTGNEKVITVLNDHQIVAAALEFFANSECISVREIDVAVKASTT